MGEGGWLVGTGGGPYFSKNKVFSGGSGLGCRLGRSWTVPTGHQDPLPPKSVLSSGSLFYFVLVGSGTCLSLWGPLRASGTLPSGRPSRQARRCHAGGVTKGVSFQKIPTPCPLPLLQYVREVGLPQREGEIILYISFQRGAMVASGDRPSPTEAAAETKLPPLEPPVGRGSGGK